MAKEVKEPVRVYTVYGVNTSNVWEFSYSLQGSLRSFKILEGVLNEKQIAWLFNADRFPYKESYIQGWQEAIKNLRVEIGEPKLDFETFYNLYGYKMSPKQAEKAWNKTSKANQLLAVTKIKAYKGFLRRNGQKQAYPATYLNQEMYKSEFNKY